MHTIIDIYGRNREPLPKGLEEPDLIKWLCDHWIQYWECEKCGRFSYCKHPAGNRRADMQCGVAVDALTNFINSTYEIYISCNDEQKQHYLDAAFYFCRFVHDNEIDIGKFANSYHVQDWAKGREDNATSLFSCVLRSRHVLDCLAENLRKIDAFPSIEGVVLVEGWSEYAFIHNLKESGLWHFDDLRIDVYEGKGNRKAKKLQLLSKKYMQTGFRLFLQGDADGQTADIFSEHRSRFKMGDNQLFAFKYDLETSYPSELAAKAATELGWVKKCQQSKFVKSLDECVESKILVFDSFFPDDWDKVVFASVVSLLLSKDAITYWHDDNFKKSELGIFLDFVQQAKWYPINSS